MRDSGTGGEKGTFYFFGKVECPLFYQFAVGGEDVDRAVGTGQQPAARAAGGELARGGSGVRLQIFNLGRRQRTEVFDIRINRWRACSKEVSKLNI